MNSLVKIILFFLVPIALVWAATPVSASSVLVKDINTDTESGNLTSDFYQFAGSTYFVKGGREIWRTDGTTEGTVLIKSFSSNVGDLYSNGSLFFFSASDGVHGVELWKSDGTTEGTVMVKDIRAGSNSGLSEMFGREMGMLDGEIYFAAHDNTHGSELWKSDGTEEGTVFLKELRPGLGGSVPNSFFKAGGLLYFRAYSDSTANEIYRTDGTADGTFLLKDFLPGGSLSGTPQDFPAVQYNDQLYFLAIGSTEGYELFTTDGTTLGTVAVKDVYPGATGSAGGSGLVISGGMIYFSADDGVHGHELWKSDGTELGTVMVKDLNTDEDESFLPILLTDVGGTLYFGSNDGVNGFELWKSDGTELGTVMVKDINTESGADSLHTTAMITDGNETSLYFVANDGTQGYELWKSDGTEGGTVMVKDINTENGVEGSNPSSLYINSDDSLYFIADDGVHGQELWQSDGTAPGTFMVKDLNVKTGDSVNDMSGISINGTIYFTADDGVHGTELWKTDGTEGGTVLVKDIVPGLVGSSPFGLTVHGNQLYFFAYDVNSDGELWKSDGTESGTQRVIVVSDPSEMISYNGAVYFSAVDSPDGLYGAELWKTDGTEGGTVLVKDINPDSEYSYPQNFFIWKNALYFQAGDGTNGHQLWKTDGTEGGTVRVTDIASPELGNFVPAGDSIYFFNTLVELWKTDGTTEGTVLVKDIYPPGNVTFSQSALMVGSTLYFSSYDGSANGLELWKSDGTEAGTVMVKNIAVGDTQESSPSNFVSYKNQLFFQARDTTNGFELWKSDGTEAGTVMVKNINSSGSASPDGFKVIDGTLYFGAVDEALGRELWKTDGTEAGTVLVDDICSGACESSPEMSTSVLIGNKMIFSAYTSTYGQELYFLAIELQREAPVVQTPRPASSNGNTGRRLARMTTTLPTPVVPAPPQAPVVQDIQAPLSTPASEVIGGGLNTTPSGVRDLQIFLNRSGFQIVETGPGSPGRETTTFGQNTERALLEFLKFQTEILLQSWGLLSQ